MCLCVRRNIFRFPVPLESGKAQPFPLQAAILCLSTRWRSHFNNRVLASHTHNFLPWEWHYRGINQRHKMQFLDQIRWDQWRGKCMLSKKSFTFWNVPKSNHNSPCQVIPIVLHAPTNLNPNLSYFFAILHKTSWLQPWTLLLWDFHFGKKIWRLTKQLNQLNNKHFSKVS